MRRAIPRACIILIYQHAMARIAAASEACSSARRTIYTSRGEAATPYLGLSLPRVYSQLNIYGNYEKLEKNGDWKVMDTLLEVNVRKVFKNVFLGFLVHMFEKSKMFWGNILDAGYWFVTYDQKMVFCFRIHVFDNDYFLISIDHVFRIFYRF